MFGLVTASVSELDQAQKDRYTAVYCGICRAIRGQAGQLCRLALSYDVAFLALLLQSLYEPEEAGGKRSCMLHPVHPHPWTDSEIIRYAADMNVALAYYKALDDVSDEGKLSGKAAAKVLGRYMEPIRSQYPRQCKAIEENLREIDRLEKAGCDNPDLPAGAFGDLLAEVLLWKEDLWSGALRQIGQALGRFIYLADAAIDYRSDLKKGSYNPFIAMGTGEDWARWEEYLVLAMGRCCDAYERLPLVQDKKILDNILYSGVWTNYRMQQKKSQEGEA